MGALVNGIMRGVSSLFGLLAVAMGGIWILQGFDLAFRVGMMVGHKQWALYGAVLVLIGVAQLIWSNTRERYYRQRG
jgi:hypothetical protein